LEGAFELFRDDKSIDVLAGLRPRLMMDAEKGDYRILKGMFTSVKQAIGLPRIKNDKDYDTDEATCWLKETFIPNCLANGYVSKIIQQYDAQGKLTIC